MYRRIFLSQKTMTVAAICAAIFCFAAFVTGRIAGALDMFSVFALAATLLLAVFLFIGYRKHSVLSMQAGCCGLLLAIVFTQANRVFSYLLTQSINQYIVKGFWGCMLLACELTLFILEVLITFNHFYFYIGNRINFLRVAYNQTLIYVLSFFVLFHMVLDTLLFPGAMSAAHACASVLFILSRFVMISCAELIIALDADERGHD